MKSLLQIILLLLIILILGGIYFIYFYSGPLKYETKLNISNLENEKVLSKNEVEEDNNIVEQEITPGIKNKNDINENSKEKNNTIENEKALIDEKSITNLTKEIEYVTTSSKGNIFKISAEYGTTNIKNSDILDLEIVKGLISSKERSEINVSSEKAMYNYDNQDSKFYKNVIIKYDDKTITCENLDLILSDNIAVAYNNVIVKDEKSIMKAQMITLDTISKIITINSQDKIKIITK